MPDTDDSQETWKPKRGVGFKIVVWGLLSLIVFVALGSLLVFLVS